MTMALVATQLQVAQDAVVKTTGDLKDIESARYIRAYHILYIYYTYYAYIYIHTIYTPYTSYTSYSYDHISTSEQVIDNHFANR